MSDGTKTTPYKIIVLIQTQTLYLQFQLKKKRKKESCRRDASVYKGCIPTDVVQTFKVSKMSRLEA